MVKTFDFGYDTTVLNINNFVDMQRQAKKSFLSSAVLE